MPKRQRYGEHVREEGLQIVVLYQPERLAEVLLALRRAGLSAQGCTSPAELLALLRQRPWNAVVLDVHALGPEAYTLITRLRRSRDLIIVAGGPGLGPERRILALESGADACLCETSDNRELAYVLHALGRRAGLDISAESPLARLPERSWELRDQGWTLVSPDGHEFALSANERVLVHSLWQKKGRAVARADLAAALAQDGLRARVVGARSVDVLVSRLRRRLARSGCTLPLRTVYGSGYLFADE